MPNISDGRVAARIDRCWELYTAGLIAALAEALPPARDAVTLLEAELDPVSAGNASVEMGMLEAILAMVTAEGKDDSIVAAGSLAETAMDARSNCDDLHRLAACTVGVHAAMRMARLRLAEERFRQALALAQALISEGGARGVGLDDVCTVFGCAGLYLAETAATARDADTTFALLDQSVSAAEQLGHEHAVMGQFFGPQHVLAVRCVCLTVMERFPEAISVGRSVERAALVPLVRATLLRAMAEACERVEAGGARELLAEADSVVPPLRRQFGLDGGARAG